MKKNKEAFLDLNWTVQDQFKKWMRDNISPHLHRGERTIHELFHLPIRYFRIKDCKAETRSSSLYATRYNVDCYINQDCLPGLIGKGNENFKVIGFIYFQECLEIVVEQNYDL